MRYTSCVQEAVKKKIEQKKILIYLSILLSLTISAHRHEHALIHQMYSKQKIRQTNSSSTRYTRMLPQLTFIRPNPIMPLGVHSRKVVGQFQVFPRRLVVNSWLEQKKSSFKRGLSHYEGGWILWNHFLDELERGSLGREREELFSMLLTWIKQDNREKGISTLNVRAINQSLSHLCYNFMKGYLQARPLDTIRYPSLYLWCGKTHYKTA